MRSGLQLTPLPRTRPSIAAMGTYTSGNSCGRYWRIISGWNGLAMKGRRAGSSSRRPWLGRRRSGQRLSRTMSL
uniref:Uncharacterized protein n=1 Tax=Arundo donax TaxID=35708 RepID=A0A0A9F237_ARUDO